MRIQNVSCLISEQGCRILLTVKIYSGLNFFHTNLKLLNSVLICNQSTVLNLSNKRPLKGLLDSSKTRLNGERKVNVGSFPFTVGF